MDEMPQFDDRPDFSASIEKRIGERYSITVPVSYALLPVGRFRSKPKPREVMTTDWSYTGLSFVSEVREELVERLFISLTIGPVTGQSLVRAIRPTDDPDKRLYGIEFRDQALEYVARDLISIHLGRVPDDRRSHAIGNEIPTPYQPDLEAWL